MKIKFIFFAIIYSHKNKLFKAKFTWYFDSLKKIKNSNKIISEYIIIKRVFFNVY